MRHIQTDQYDPHAMDQIIDIQADRRGYVILFHISLFQQRNFFIWSRDALRALIENFLWILKMMPMGIMATGDFGRKR